MTTTPASGAADLPEALRRSTAADGKTELFNLPGYPLMVRAVDFNRIHTESEMRRTALLDEMQKAALAAGQAPAAQAVVQDDLITLRKPTTSAELLWLLKLAHLVISGVDKTLEETFAPAQPAAQQEADYAALPEYGINTASHAHFRVLGFTADQMRAFADATHMLRASHGQAPAKPDPAYSAACNLATELFKKHFAHLPDFASGQAVWSLCDSTAGVISQIDNMVAGLVQPPTISPQADSVQEDAALWHWLAEYLVGTRTDLDDEIVASETVNDLRNLVESAIKQGEKQ